MKVQLPFSTLLANQLTSAKPLHWRDEFTIKFCKKASPTTYKLKFNGWLIKKIYDNNLLK